MKGKNKMINRSIIISLDNVHKAEQETLKKYLEYNCWDWKIEDINECNEQKLYDDNYMTQGQLHKANEREK